MISKGEKVQSQHYVKFKISVTTQSTTSSVNKKCSNILIRRNINTKVLMKNHAKESLIVDY